MTKPRSQSRIIGTATETNTAMPITATKSVTIGQATETSIALPLVVTQARQIVTDIIESGAARAAGISPTASATVHAPAAVASAGAASPTVVGDSAHVTAADRIRSGGEASRASPTSRLTNTEWVYIVGVAEVIRQIAIDKYDVAQDHAAVIWIVAIYMLAQLWARASDTPDLDVRLSGIRPPRRWVKVSIDARTSVGSVSVRR